MDIQELAKKVFDDLNQDLPGYLEDAEDDKEMALEYALDANVQDEYPDVTDEEWERVYEIVVPMLQSALEKL